MAVRYTGASAAAVRGPRAPGETASLCAAHPPASPPAIAPPITKDAATTLSRCDGGAGEPLLSVKQVAEQLGIATATVYGLCADGRLAHVRVLNVIRIPPSDLDAFIASQRRSVRRRP